MAQCSKGCNSWAWPGSSRNLLGIFPFHGVFHTRIRARGDRPLTAISGWRSETPEVRFANFGPRQPRPIPVVALGANRPPLTGFSLFFIVQVRTDAWRSSPPD